jgi:hypothetical protein
MLYEDSNLRTARNWVEDSCEIDALNSSNSGEESEKHQGAVGLSEREMRPRFGTAIRPRSLAMTASAEER